MPARANAFYERLVNQAHINTDPLKTKARVYHATTKARVKQANFFLDCLTGDATLEAPEYLDGFDKRDMLIFGLVNSLRSSLDSLTHELVLFYNGSAKNRRDIQFSKLLKPEIQLSAPPTLCDLVREFRDGNTFWYLNRLRVAQQHRRHALIQTQAVSRMAFTVVGQDGEGTPAGWGVSDASAQGAVEAVPATDSRPEPDLRLPDDPDVEPGDETFSPGRPLFDVARHLYRETREFILASYALAV